MKDFPFTMEMAPLGQVSKQGCATQPRHMLLTSYLLPREMGRGILERVLGYSDYHARDDMTVVVAGLWKK